MFGKKKVDEEEREIERCCGYCVHSALLDGEEQVLCRKKGVVSADACCRKFRYDLLKRRPRSLPVPEIDPEDLIL